MIGYQEEKTKNSFDWDSFLSDLDQLDIKPEEEKKSFKPTPQQPKPGEVPSTEFPFDNFLSDLEKLDFGKKEEEEERQRQKSLLGKVLTLPKEGVEALGEIAKIAYPQSSKEILELMQTGIGGYPKEYMKRIRRETTPLDKRAPEKPVISAPSPEQRKAEAEFHLREAQKAQAVPDKYGKWGTFEKFIDVPGQALAQFVKGYSWGAPVLLAGPATQPKSELAGAVGGISHLAGLVGAGMGELAMYAPIKVAGKVMSRVLRKPAKTAAGKFLQNVLKNANTLGLALGASEWKGHDAKDVLNNKLNAFLQGEAIGGFFGGMQFMHFQKLHPILSYILRLGTGSALLDIARGQHPFDERTLMDKAFDYGLNAYFLKPGVSLKEYNQVTNSILEQTRRFNKQMEAEGYEARLPESLKEIRERIDKPETYIKPEFLPSQKQLPPPPKFVATERGTVMPPETPEKTALEVGYREAEIPRAERGEARINVKPLKDGSVDVTIRRPTEKVTEKIRTKQREAGKEQFEQEIRGAIPREKTPEVDVADRVMAATEFHPKIGYSLITKTSEAFEANPKEVARIIEQRGKEVFGKPKPKERVIKPKEKKRQYEDPLLQAIYEHKRIKPNKDYSRESLKEILPPELIANKNDPAAKPMDLMAHSLKEQFPRIEGDTDLYRMLENAKLGRQRGRLTEREAAEEEFARWKERQYEEKELEKEEEVPFEIPKAETKTEPKAKEEFYRITPEMRDIEKRLREGEELTKEQKKHLKEKGMYEYKDLSSREKTTPEPEMEIPKGKMRLVKVDVQNPLGKTAEVTAIPAKRAKEIKDYARSMGMEGKVKIREEYEGKWREYLPPEEHVKIAKDYIKAAKEEPKEAWEEWFKRAKKEEEGMYELYSGMPPPEFTKHIGRRLLDKLQVEPQFRRIGAPDTGIALKRYHPIRNESDEKGLQAVRDLNAEFVELKNGERVSIREYKRTKRLQKIGIKEELGKLSDKDLQQLTILASHPTKFKSLSSAERRRLSGPYRYVRRFFKEYEKRLKEEEIITEGWPKSQIRRLTEEKKHINASLKEGKISEKARANYKQRLKDINDTITFIKRFKPQYVHIPKEWLQAFFDKYPEEAPRVISQFFRQRKTMDMESLTNYLLEKGVIDKKDLDIRKIMSSYAHKAGHKIALAEIFNTAKKEGLIKEMSEAPDSWQKLPSTIFPNLKGKKVHPVLKDYFEKNFLKKGGWGQARLKGVLGAIKIMQFHNPLFLPMYDTIQSFWSGALTSTKTPKAVRRAWKSMREADDAYWDMHYWGGFSTPYSPGFQRYSKQVQRNMERSPFIMKALKRPNPYIPIWKTAWWGDHAIRMITYHHNRIKGMTPKDAAQTAARLHGDYASIPPGTRKWINKIFFTPSFKISMLSGQTEMIKNAGKALTKERKTMTKKDLAMAKALPRLAAGMALREAVMHALGFETDKFGLKYTKTITIDGEEKQLVLHAASPDNVVLRYWHRFGPVIPFVGKEQNKFEGLVNRAKWELHPLWQLTQEVLSNKGTNMKPIFNPFEGSEKIAYDTLNYTLRRLARITEVLPGEHKAMSRREAYNALVEDTSKIKAGILSAFTLPYTRSPKERSISYKIYQLKQLFNKMKKEDPPKTEEEAAERFKRFQQKLEKYRKELREIYEMEK